MDQAHRDALGSDARVDVVTTETIPDVSEDLHPGDPGFAQRAWNMMLLPATPDTTRNIHFQDPPDTTLERGAFQRDPLKQTSTYLMGDVGVSSFFMESDDDRGCGDPDTTENWVAAEKDSMASLAAQGLVIVADANPESDVTFLFLETRTIGSPVEPDLYKYGDDLWVRAAMDTLGFHDGSAGDRCWALNNDRRSRHKTDWWYTNFMVRDICNPRHYLAYGGSHVYAISGPYAVLLYQESGAEPERLVRIAAHEALHIFGAVDEYAYVSACDSTYGYLQVSNGNGYESHYSNAPCDPPRRACVMYDDTYGLWVCSYTRQHVGWRDSHGFGVMDPICNPEATASMVIGEDDSLEVGDRVDIYDGSETWVKRLVATRWNCDGGRMLWDGIDYKGDSLRTGAYTWTKNEFPTSYPDTLRPDVDAPVIRDFTISPGPDSLLGPLYGANLSFRFTDADSRSARVHAVALPHHMNVPPTTVIADTFYVQRDSTDTPVSTDFKVAHVGAWDLNLCLWDVGGNEAVCRVDSFWVGDRSAGVGGQHVFVPELSLSRARPNPANRWVAWEIRQRSAGRLDLRVFSVDGRCVRSWGARALPQGTTRVLWDGLDNRGVRVPSGRYYLVATDQAGRMRSNTATILR